MKVRLGFVSNSSSVSFTIYGVLLTPEQEKKLGDTWEGTKARAGGLNRFDGQADDVYVGREWCNIKDDETGAQFKEFVRSKIKELLGEGVPCATYSEGYFNG